MSGREICDQLALHPHRGWKLLHALAMIGLLEEEHGERGEYSAVFQLSREAKEYFGPDGTQGFFFRELVLFWRGVAVLPFVDVLRGLPLPDAVRWPPPERKHAEHLETWMRVTAEGATKTIHASKAMQGAKRLLDVGGGDGTIGCDLPRCIPNWKPRSSICQRRHTWRVKTSPLAVAAIASRFTKGIFSRTSCQAASTESCSAAC